MRRLFIEVEESAFQIIADVATAERRTTRDQIAILVAEAAKMLTRQREAIAARDAKG